MAAAYETKDAGMLKVEWLQWSATFVAATPPLLLLRVLHVPPRALHVVAVQPRVELQAQAWIHNVDSRLGKTHHQPLHPFSVCTRAFPDYDQSSDGSMKRAGRYTRVSTRTTVQDWVVRELGGAVLSGFVARERPLQSTERL